MNKDWGHDEGAATGVFDPKAWVPSQDLLERIEAENKRLREAAKNGINERVAQLTAHRACHNQEQDVQNGKLGGYCIVCGVPWPCEIAKPKEAQSAAGATLLPIGWQVQERDGRVVVSGPIGGYAASDDAENIASTVLAAFARAVVAYARPAHPAVEWISAAERFAKALIHSDRTDELYEAFHAGKVPAMTEHEIEKQCEFADLEYNTSKAAFAEEYKKTRPAAPRAKEGA